MIIFHREAYAQELASKVLSAPVISATGSGVFLAGMRRTGKSTFIREDLRPALEHMGALVIYVDLWADKAADPGDVITNAIREALAQHEGVMARLARNTGIEKVSVAGLQFSLKGSASEGSGITLSSALSALSDECGKVIVLVIDEAQQAIGSKNGANTLFALKAARDELNSSAHHGLRIVATGSNRDKLAMLRNSKDQAFFGTPMVDFTLLGQDYIDWFVSHLPFKQELDPGKVYEWFVEAGHRPEVIGAAVDALIYDPTIEPGQFADRFHAAIQEEVAENNDTLLRQVHSLPTLQSAVLRVMAESGARYAPFEAQTMARYRATLARIDPEFDITPDSSNIQKALATLQANNLVWKSARGVYALEEAGLADLMRNAGLLDESSMPDDPGREPGPDDSPRPS